jgi:hypothetical protein
MSIKYDAALIYTAFQQIAKRKFKDEAEFLHTCRMELEPYIFGTLNHRYGTELQRHWDSCTIPTYVDKTVVIVERRCHPNLRFCLQNAAYYARGWAITVVCSDVNEAYVKACAGSQLSSVRIIPFFKGLGTPEEGKTEYNTVLQEWRFWELFLEEHLLMMETDTYLTKPLPASLLEYDYVASKWPWAPDAAGGGGLSYRKRSMMKHVCSQDFPIQKAQDCFISEAVEKLHFKTPTIEESTRFFGEFAFVPTMCGTHQWWTGIRSHDLDSIAGALTLALV